jgi:hypothetical protein
MDPISISGIVLSLIKTFTDKAWPDPAKKAEAELRLIEMQQNGEFRQQELQLSAVIEEAKSADPWTSRARPSFLYVVYVMILASIPMGILHAFAPETAAAIAVGMQAWLAAIPSEVWTLFGAGYLGYAGARSFDKAKRLDVRK